MRVWTYKQIMPKLLVAKLKLIEPVTLIDLVGRSLEYIFSVLIKTPYRTEISEILDHDRNVRLIEDALLRNYITTCRELKDYSPKNIKILLSTYLKKFEVENIKAMIKANWAGLDVHEAMKFLIPAGRLDESRCRNVLVHSKSISDVIELLSDLEYGAPLKEALRDHEETGSLLPFEVVLYNQVYEQITKAIKKLRGKDRKIAEIILGMEIDSLNIMVILRGKSRGVARDQIQRSLLPLSGILTEKALESAVDSEDVMSSIRILQLEEQVKVIRDYQYLFEDLLAEYIVSQSISQLELVINRNLLNASLRMIQRYTPYFNIGLVFAFLNTKWFEVKNLRIIIRGSEDDVPAERIKELLILPKHSSSSYISY